MARHRSTRATPPVQPKRPPPKNGFGFLATILDGIDSAEIVATLEACHAAAGRPGYPAEAMLRAYLAKFLLSVRYNNQLLERLRSSPRLRAVCGFGDDVPSESAFSRFTTRLKDHRGLLERPIRQITAQLHKKLPDLGKVTAIDSTAITSFANPRGSVPTDPDARWGIKHSARAKGKDGEDFFYGYKWHLLADATHGIPLSYTLTPGNDNDSPELPKVVRKALSENRWLKPKYLLADRGYDGQPNHRFLVDKKIIPIIHIRKPTAEDGLQDGIYDADGRPLCLGSIPMEYVKTDSKTGRHLFQCAAEGCHLKGQGLVPNCRQEVWEDPEDNLRAIGVLPRFTAQWKRLYAQRWSIERDFSVFKQSRGLESHRIRGMAGMEMLVATSMLTYLATAKARLDANDAENIRRMALKVA